MLNEYGSEREHGQIEGDPFKDYSDEELEKEVARVIGDFEETLGLSETKVSGLVEDKYAKLKETIRQKIGSSNPDEKKFGELLGKQFDEFEKRRESGSLGRQTKSLENRGTERLDDIVANTGDKNTRRLD